MAMEQMTRIDWTISTGDKWWSGTDDTVQVEIWNDSNMIIRLNVEPADTSRLNRGETVNYYWVFRDPSGLGTSVSGTTVPYYVRFPRRGRHHRQRRVGRGVPRLRVQSGRGNQHRHRRGSPHLDAPLLAGPIGLASASPDVVGLTGRGGNLRSCTR